MKKKREKTWYASNTVWNVTLHGKQRWHKSYEIAIRKIEPFPSTVSRDGASRPGNGQFSCYLLKQKNY
jgi:hypothetical protein